MSKELAASGQLSAEQDYKSVWKPDELERIIDQYVKHYELNDGESTYDPSDEERIVIKDAIMGLLVDREWDNEWGKHIAALSSLRGTFADGIEAAAKDGVDAIISDFTTRRGLRQEWENIDEEIQQEIIDKWRSAIRALAQGQRLEAVSNAERVDINQGTSVRPTDKQSSDHPTEVDELLRNGAAGLRGYATLLSFSREVGREEVGRKYDLQADAIDAYLARKEQ